MEGPQEPAVASRLPRGRCRCFRILEKCTGRPCVGSLRAPLCQGADAETCVTSSLSCMPPPSPRVQYISRCFFRDRTCIISLRAGRSFPVSVVLRFQHKDREPAFPDAVEPQAAEEKRTGGESHNDVASDPSCSALSACPPFPQRTACCFVATPQSDCSTLAEVRRCSVCRRNISLPCRLLCSEPRREDPKCCLDQR